MKTKTNVLGACMRLLLGATSLPFGSMSMARLGAKYAEVGSKVCGSWVQSMRKLGASLWILLGACMRLLGVWVHVYGLVGCMYAVVG